MDFLKLSSLFLAIFIESFLLLQKWPLLSNFLFLSSLLLALFILKSLFFHHSPVYLVDFSCYKPPSHCRVSFSAFIQHSSLIKSFNKDSISFMSKILTSSGVSDHTYLPPALHSIPPKPYHQEAINEVHMVLFSVMDNLLSKTKLSPQQIDILIVNCSGFCPSPSLSSILVNKYSMRTEIKNFTLSGMGCSASALAVDMAQNLLKVHKNSYAVILSTEILSTGWYSGNEKPKLLLNCLFRMGSAAILLTNKKEARKSSKYKIVTTLRTLSAFEDKSYNSAFREEDTEGNLGFALKRDVLQNVSEVLQSNVTSLGSSILPFLEKLRYGFSIIWKKYIDKSAEIYVPNFNKVMQHFCLPTSGKAVIKEIAEGLKLGEREMEAALMTFHRFGNQSSSSIWYELAYMEAKERVKKGDRVWQLGVGSGLKCISVVLECMKHIVGEAGEGPWADSIDRYPINLVDLAP